jgi:hypothetical protein
MGMPDLFNDAPFVVPTYQQAKLTLEEALSGSPVQKQLYFLDATVQVEGFTKARKFVDALLDRRKRLLKPGGLWIIGDGGVGKSFVLNDIHKRHPLIDTNIARITPLIWLSFRSRPSISDLLCTMLLQLGQDPDLMKNRDNQHLEDSLVDALKASGTLGIMFDEAHHLWLTTTGKRHKDRIGGLIGDLLKRLYDATPLAYIFSGTPGLTDAVFLDKQVSTRWPGIITLKQFNLDKQFYGLLNALDRAIPLPEPTVLAQKKFADKIHMSTGGNFRLIKELLGEAIFLAANDDSPKIGMKHLAESHFITFGDRENPFQ